MGQIALEYSPQGEGAVVSVITRGNSDESLSRVVDGSSLYLRISRLGSTVTLQLFAQRGVVDLGRYCRFEGNEVHVGFGSQSSTGNGTTARFRDIVLRPTGVEDFRTGI